VIGERQVGPVIHTMKPGYYKQQAIKLCLHKIIKSEFALICDSDIFLNCPLSTNHFIKDGRAKFYLDSKTKNFHPEWAETNRKFLGLSTFKNYSIFVTPNLMSKSVLVEFHKYIAKKYSSNSMNILKEKEGQYTEWEAYGRFLIEIMGIKNSPHFLASSQKDIRGIWNLRQFQRFNPKKLRQPMSVIQSRVPISYGE
jgi:hypothetical protein